MLTWWKRWGAGLGLASLALLAGCGTPEFNNLTSSEISQNPSNIYTFSFAAQFQTTNIIEESVKATIVINEETHPMRRSQADPNIFTFDYAMPDDVAEARYYFILEYDYNNQGDINSSTRYSHVYGSQLVNRYPIQLVSNRGPVGSTIALVGAGFAAGDVMVIGGVEAVTTVHSGSSLDFVVPPLTPGESYPAVLRTVDADLPVGNFRVDAARMNVQFSGDLGSRAGSTGGADQMNVDVGGDKIRVYTGESILAIVEINGVAPAGGIMLEVSTDIPDSVIMPEVYIGEGESTVNVNIEGGVPGEGTLYFEAPGFNEVAIPIEVY